MLPTIFFDGYRKEIARDRETAKERAEIDTDSWKSPLKKKTKTLLLFYSTTKYIIWFINNSVFLHTCGCTFMCDHDHYYYCCCCCIFHFKFTKVNFGWFLILKQKKLTKKSERISFNYILFRLKHSSFWSIVNKIH